MVKLWRKLLDHKTCDEWTGEKPEEGTDETFNEEEIAELVKNLPGFKIMKEVDVNKWLSADEQNELTDGDILNMVFQNDDINSDSKGDESTDKNPVVISHYEAFMSLEALLCYIESREDTCASHVMLLKRMRDMALKKTYTT
ncbi:unnamed protein product [Diabrotica balteata]|uniref:Uncharacterized protein n=1 Tax=Diabrotica balteata TaxID=107213 RepID=A0A9N9SX59_DIABA|nr:unnamed protein product [Diabrotica balteata]